MALEGTIAEVNALVGSLNATGSMEGAIVGAKGDKGDKGDTGDTGNGIASIAKTGTSGLVDTYTITYTNGTTATFTVTNGADGADGADGYSPSASVSKSGDTATVTITDKDGTTTATITDGQDGADGQDGQDGQDGHTPVITASKVGKVTTVYADGVAIATINDGVDGQGAVTDVTVNGVTVMDGDVAKVIVPTKVSDLNNDSGFITAETDPTVPSWAKQSTKPTYTASEVGALPSSTQIPSKTSDLTNDSGFVAVDSITVTLTVAGWSSDAQTVTATGVTSSNTVIVAPSPSDMADYTDAGIKCTAQGTNTLTFECDTTPSSAIDVNVVII